MTGDFQAEKALIRQVYAALDGAEGDGITQVLADHLAAGPRVAQGVIRGLVAQAYETSEADQLDAERDAMAFAAGQDEAAEGIAAFLEKRTPVYK